MHTDVFFDSTHSAFLMQALQILICFFHMAFWPCSLVEPMQLPAAFPYLFIALLCHFFSCGGLKCIHKALDDFSFSFLNHLTSFRRYIFEISDSHCRCRFRKARFVGKRRHKWRRPYRTNKRILFRLIRVCWPFYVVAYSARMAYHWKDEESKHACSKRKWTRYQNERKRESMRKRKS